MKQHVNQNKLKLICLLSITGVLWILGFFAYCSLLDRLNEHYHLINNAPINPNESQSYALLNGLVQLDLLSDTVIPVTCCGQRLNRFVEQYVLFTGQEQLSLIPVPENALYRPQQFPIVSKNIQEENFTLKQIKIPSVFIPLALFKKAPDYQFQVSTPLPAHVIPLDQKTFFIGKDPALPEENNMIIHYECEDLPAITAWGAIDNSLILKNSYLGGGLSALSLDEQKNKLLKNIHYAQDSLISIASIIITLNMLIIAKILYSIGALPFLKRLIRKIQRIELFLSFFILFIPTHFIWALSVSCLLVFYFGLGRIIQYQPYSKLSL
jgi:hypothetical protein